RGAWLIDSTLPVCMLWCSRGPTPARARSAPALGAGQLRRLARAAGASSFIHHPCGCGIVALPHLIDQRDRVLQERQLLLERFEQRLARGDAGRLRPDGGLVLRNRLVENPEVLVDRRRRRGIERFLVRLRDFLELEDRLL